MTSTVTPKPILIEARVTLAVPSEGVVEASPAIGPVFLGLTSAILEGVEGIVAPTGVDFQNIEGAALEVSVTGSGGVQTLSAESAG